MHRKQAAPHILHAHIQEPNVNTSNLAPCRATFNADDLLSSLAARTGDSRLRFPALSRAGLPRNEKDGDDGGDGDGGGDEDRGGASITF